MAAANTRVVRNIPPTEENIFVEVKGELEECEGFMKVAFIDYGYGDPTYIRSPEKIRESLAIVGEIMSGFCKGQKNTEKHCERIHF